MEAELAVVCALETPQMAELFKTFMDEDTRPILEDEVEEVYREIFNTIDEIQYAETTEIVDQNKLKLWFFVGGGDHYTEITFILDTLKKAGVKKLSAAVFMDGLLQGILKNERQSVGHALASDVEGNSMDADQVFEILLETLN